MEICEVVLNNVLRYETLEPWENHVVVAETRFRENDRYEFWENSINEFEFVLEIKVTCMELDQEL